MRNILMTNLSATLLLLVNINFHAKGQQVYACAPCGMECDKAEHTSGGICPDPTCYRMLMWKGSPSILWPTNNLGTNKLLFNLQSFDETSNSIYEYSNGRLKELGISAQKAEYSPNGKKILYSLEDNIYLFEYGKHTNLSEKYGLKGGASWLDDDHLVVTIGDWPKTKIYKYTLKNNMKSLISGFDGFNYAPSASVNGDVAFSSLRKGLFLLQKGNDEPIKIHPSGEYVSFSPDSQKMAFHAQSKERRFSIYTANIDGSNLKEIKKIIGFDCELPSWSANGNEIYFMSNKRHGNWDLFKMKSDGTDEVLILKSEDFVK